MTTREGFNPSIVGEGDYTQPWEKSDPREALVTGTTGSAFGTGSSSTTGSSVYMPSWLRGTTLEQVWIDAWAESGDGQLAIQAVREAPEYDQIFAGNRRDDGSLRYDEATYFGLKESYYDSLLSINVNPDLFVGKFSDLIAGEVSPSEFAVRVNSLYERVLTASDAIKNYYASEFAFDMTDEAIVASFLDPDIGQSILNRQIAVSEVGGEASSRNFTVGRDLAERMVNFGVDTAQEAQTLFAEAETLVPALTVLANRHADPDDDFDITDFSNAIVFGDPEQRRRMRRLMAQERATFGADRGLTVAQGAPGSLTGLTER